MQILGTVQGDYNPLGQVNVSGGCNRSNIAGWGL